MAFGSALAFTLLLVWLYRDAKKRHHEVDNATRLVTAAIPVFFFTFGVVLIVLGACR